MLLVTSGSTTASVVELPRRSERDQRYYCLPSPQELQELSRLNSQHFVLKALFDGHIVHPDIPLSLDPSILDSGTGTSAWLRELALTSPRAELCGFDASSDQFITDHPRLRLFRHSVVDPLPREHVAKYDLVHQRLLVAGLSKLEWKIAFPNLYDALKPGAWIQLMEINTLFNEQHCQRAESFKLAHKVAAHLEHLGNRDFHIVDNISTYLSEAGFVNQRRIDKEYVTGPFARSKFGNTELARQSTECLAGVWAGMSVPFLASGGLPHLGLSTQSDIDRWLARWRTDVEEVGLTFPMTMIVAQRPL